MIRARRARIVATLGPATRKPEQIVALARAGADVFRVNFSHGEHADHATAIARVRAAEAEVGRPLAVLADLQGPKIRLGEFRGGRVELTRGQAFRLDRDPTPGDSRRVCVPHPEIFAALRTGADVLLDDGKVRLKVVRFGQDFAETEVISGDILSDHKGLNLPGLAIPIPALTEKDRLDLDFALAQGVDWVALSFVQRAADMAELRQIVLGRAGVLAKIEKPAALEALDEILDLSEAVMVARGDLGVELAPEDVPVVQKTLVRAARMRGIPVIVATQMLESMIHSPTPTRAEASDVAAAVYEGADAVMLSAETAAGKFPVETIEATARICTEADRSQRVPLDGEFLNRRFSRIDQSIAMSALFVAHHLSIKAIVALTQSGSTALWMSRLDSGVPIYALTPEERSRRRMTLYREVHPVLLQYKSVEGAALLIEAEERLVAAGLVSKGDRIIITIGEPIGKSGGTNTMKIVTVGEHC